MYKVEVTSPRTMTLNLEGGYDFGWGYVVEVNGK